MKISWFENIAKISLKVSTAVNCCIVKIAKNKVAKPKEKYLKVSLPVSKAADHFFLWIIKRTRKIFAHTHAPKNNQILFAQIISKTEIVVTTKLK